MDHLPEIVDPAFPDDLVHCKLDPKDGGYIGPDLRGYPVRKGFDFEEGHGQYAGENYRLRGTNSSVIACSVDSMHSFAISWLFFGPLTEIFSSVLNLRLDPTDFMIDVGNGTRLLHLKGLEWYVLQWKNREQSLGTEPESLSDDSFKEERKKNIYELLELANIFVQNNLMDRGRGWKTRVAILRISPECSLLIQMLHEALLYAWGEVYGSRGVAILSGSGISSTVTDARMHAANWCPSEISMLQQRFSVTGRYFASRLKRTKSRTNHESCSETKCYASQIDNDTYVTKHTEIGCQCKHIRVDHERVTTILQAGKIPRFSLQPQANSETGYQVEIKESGPFVAISHVWAHGLGNARENSLPLCQIRRLRSYVSSLGPPSKENQATDSADFWIDTLGVPLERKSRVVALQAMRQTYEESSRCLVLDEELYNASVNCSPEEIWLRLALSTWSRRLWTFQEGFLSGGKLYLQFLDGSKSVQELRRVEKPTLCSPLFSECIEEAKRNLPRGDDLIKSDQRLIASITEACRYRTTSRLSDESFCLASTAGLDIREIVAAPNHEDKMRMFLLQLHKLPQSIVFHTGPRLMIDNFHWAPLTFLYPEPSSNIFGSNDDSMNDALAICLPSGLQGRWPGFTIDFQAKDQSNRQMYFFRYGEYWILIHPITTMKQVLSGAAVVDDEQISVWQNLQQMKRPALLVESLDSLQNVGLMVSIESKDLGSDMIIAQCILRVNASLIPTSEPDIFDPKEIDLEKVMQISGQLVDSEKMWLLR